MTGLSYWQARQAILDALEAKDDFRLEELSNLYPLVFENLTRMAKNQITKRRRK